MFYQISWPMSLAPTYEAIRHETSGKPLMREKPAEFWGTGHQCKDGCCHQLSIIFESMETFTRIVGLYLGLYLQFVSLFWAFHGFLQYNLSSYVCCHLLSELYSVSALNPDWFICMKWDSPWYLLWCSQMVPSIWCILFTNKVIKGNANLFTRIIWCCLFSYFISELWGDRLWACPQLSSSYSWWGCEYNMYHCWQNYTSNFLGKADVCELIYWPASVSVGHPAGALAIICLWVLLTWLTYAYGMLVKMM